MADRQKFSEGTGVPVDALRLSDEMVKGKWGEVDEALRGVYKEASEALGKEYPYPADKNK